MHTLPHQQNFPLPQPIRLPPERRGNNNGSFGYLLEKELDFDEELPPTLPPPPSSFLSQQLPLPRGELLNRRGGGAHGQFPLQPQDYDLLPPSGGGLIRPVPHRPDPLQEKWMDVYPEKQVEPLRQLDPLYSSSSHRLAASTGGGRLGSTNWAVEMERRRLQELRLMQRERLLSAQAAHHATIPGSHQRVCENSLIPSSQCLLTKFCTASYNLQSLMDGVNAPHQDTNLATRGVNDVDSVGIFIDGFFRLLPELHGRSYM